MEADDFPKLSLSQIAPLGRGPVTSHSWFGGDCSMPLELVGTQASPVCPLLVAGSTALQSPRKGQGQPLYVT